MKEIPLLEKFLARPQVWCNNIKICDSTINSQFNTQLNIELQDLPAVLAEIYPNKTLMDLFIWLDFFTTNNTTLNKESLAQNYGFFWNETSENLYLQSKLWPKTFKNWCIHKKAHSNDLRPLILISKFKTVEQNSINEFISAFENLNPSLSEGKKLIELYIDVLAIFPEDMIKLSQEITTESISTETITKRLLKLRYPVITKIDSKKKNFVEKSRWPSSVKVKFLRQGDQSGFEGRFFVSGAENSNKIKKNLEAVVSMFEDFFVKENNSSNKHMDQQQ